VSRISRGTIDLRRERIELASAIHHAVEAARPLCERMDHELTVALPPKPIYLNADPIRLAQVVGSLLTNAGKFTEKGGRISLTVERKGEQAVIRVRDTGIGIAAEQLPQIFEMFTQLDTSLERPQGGLGIGLTLVKNLVWRCMAARWKSTAPVWVRVVSSWCAYRTWWKRLSRCPSRPPVSRSPRPRRILVVDDNRDAAESLTMLLKLTGYETQAAYDGLEAVEAATRYRPDVVVLLDIGLPHLNGYEAARKIRDSRGVRAWCWWP